MRKLTLFRLRPYSICSHGMRCTTEQHAPAQPQAYTASAVNPTLSL